MPQKRKVRHKTEPRLKLELPNVASKVFREGGREHKNVRISLEGLKLDEVKLVQYELHPSFREPYRVSTDPTHNFEVGIWTYGFFPVKATIIKKDGSVETVKGDVKWKT